MPDNEVSKRVLSGTLWLLLMQIITVCFQFFYAAYSSRRVDQAAFGQYALALSATALVGLVSGSGLGLSASRMVRDSEDGQRAVVTLALYSGAVTALLLSLLAGPWSALWGDSGAAATIRLLSVGLLVSPVVAVQIGLLRRDGQFAKLALLTIVASITGMVTGAICISRSPTSVSLVVSTVVSNWALYLLTSITLGNKVRPTRDMKGSRPHVEFGLKALITSILNYAAATIPALSISRWIGLGTLGQWNRSTVLAVLPIEMVTNALQRAVYPEAQGTGRDVTRIRRMWTLAPVLPSLIVWPIAGLVTPFMPDIITFLLGPKWQTAGNMGSFLVVGAAGMLTVSVLSAVQESNGFFAIVWWGTSALLVVSLTGAACLRYSGSWLAVAVASIVGPAVALVIQIDLAGRRVNIARAEIYRNLLKAACIGAVLSQLSRLIREVGASMPVTAGALLVVVVSTYLAILRMKIAEPAVSVLKMSLLQARDWATKRQSPS